MQTFTPAYFNINTGQLVKTERRVHELRPKGNFKNVLVQDMRIAQKRRKLKSEFFRAAKDMNASWYIDLIHNLNMPATALSILLVTHFTPVIIRHVKSRLVWRELMLNNHYPAELNTPKNWRMSYEL